MKKLLSLVLCGVLVFSLTGCSVVKSLLDSPEKESVTNDVYAEKGGSITLPEGMDTSRRFNTCMDGDTMYIDFNRVMTRNTGYFYTAGDTITITGYATTESPGLKEYKAGLWELTNDGMAQYVNGCTLYFTTGGDCYTGTFSGLDPNVRYKITLSYDSGTYYITGAMKVEGLSVGEEVTDEDETAENS